LNSPVDVYTVLGFNFEGKFRQTINVHKHEETWQLYYVLKGSVQYIYEEQKVSVSKNSFLLVRPLASHGMLGCGEEAEVLDMKFNINDRLLAEYLQNKPPHFRDLGGNICGLFSQILQVSQKKRLYYNQISALHLASIFYMIMQSDQAPVEKLIEHPLNIDFDKMSLCTQRVLHKMEGFVVLPPEPALPESIAKLTGYNKRYMCNKFLEDVGISITQYFMLMRIDKAKELLHDSDLKVQTISKLLGFEDVSHFIKSFKNNVGISPGEYRKQGKESDGHLIYTFRAMGN